MIVDPEAVSEFMGVIGTLGSAEILGSVARHAQTPHDVDILLVCDVSKEAVMEHISKHLHVEGIKAHGFRVRCIYRRTLFETFPSRQSNAGSARLYLEGPLGRNSALRRQARSRGMIWRFGGLFTIDGLQLPSHDRDQVFAMITGET